MTESLSHLDPKEELDLLRRELAEYRRRDAMLAIIDRLAMKAAHPAEVTSGVAAMLGEHLRVNRCVVAEIQNDENTFRVTGSYINGLDALPETFTIRDFSAPLQELLCAGHIYVVDDTEIDPLSRDSLEVYRLTGLRSTISVPLMKDGRLRGALAVHCNAPRRWTEHEISLLVSVAARCWETTERLRILRELQEDRDALLEKTAEIERQRSEIESIYRTAPIGLAQFDLDDYHYVRLNDRQAAFFDLKPEQIIGKTVTEMAPIPGVRELFDQVAAGTPVVNFPLEGALVNDLNDYRYWTVSYFPIRNDEDVITGVTAASLEITQQKRAELALIQSEKLAAVGRLAASIAHEINNPLEAVTNLLYLAKSASSLDEARNYLQDADAEVRRMAQITAQTLRFHRQSTRPTETTADELFATALGIYQPRLVAANISVQLELTTQARVSCFEGEIRQVLANLIGNAIDVMPDGGKLRLRAREGHSWATGKRGLLLVVADTGLGIAAANRERIFEPFFTTKGAAGTGLGLWVSHEIVARHNGSLRVQSSQSSAHHGTTFTLFLPFDAVTR